MKKIFFIVLTSSAVTIPIMYGLYTANKPDSLVKKKHILPKATQKTPTTQSITPKRKPTVRIRSKIYPDDDMGPLVVGEELPIIKEMHTDDDMGPLVVGEELPIIKEMIEAIKKDEELSPEESKEIVAYAKKFLGVRYRFGGENIKKAIDCSAFTKYIMKKKCNILLPRTATEQASAGRHVDKKDLKAGDLVFFKNTSKHAHISHVGIMISKTKFIHASSGAGKVTITRLYKPYYVKHYFGARRL